MDGAMIPERDMARTHTAVGLSVILILALVVRLAGIQFGLPFALARPDEVTLVHAALNIGDKGFTPHYFNYPSLHPSILAAAYLVYAILGQTTGRPGGFAGLAREFAVDPTLLLLIDRVISACLGVATVWLVDAIGRRMAGRAVGLLSALLLALAYLHARESHFGTVDVPMTFFATLALLVALKGYQDGRRSSFLLAGVCAGLAASTKYNAIAVVASVGLAYVLRRLENRPGECPSSMSATESDSDAHARNAPAVKGGFTSPRGPGGPARVFAAMAAGSWARRPCHEGSETASKCSGSDRRNTCPGPRRAHRLPHRHTLRPLGLASVHP